jgi:hypothetical protein
MIRGGVEADLIFERFREEDLLDDKLDGDDGADKLFFDDRFYIIKFGYNLYCR